MSTEYTERQAFSPVVRIGSSRPITRKRVFVSLFGTKGGGDTLADGIGGGWSPFRRRDGHSGTLGISVADPLHFGVDPDPDPRIYASD